METILNLVKTDLGIIHNKRDTYFYTAIRAAVAELNELNIEPAYDDQEYIMLVVDLVLWRYRHRAEDVPLAQNIRSRIRAFIMRRRVDNE